MRSGQGDTRQSAGAFCLSRLALFSAPELFFGSALASAKKPQRPTLLVIPEPHVSLGKLIESNLVLRDAEIGRVVVDF